MCSYEISTFNILSVNEVVTFRVGKLLHSALKELLHFALKVVTFCVDCYILRHMGTVFTILTRQVGQRSEPS